MRFAREHLPKLKPKTQCDYRLALKRYILPALGRLAVPAVTLEDVTALHRRLGRRRAGHTPPARTPTPAAPRVSTVRQRA